jgi:cell division protein FtsQ
MATTTTPPETDLEESPPRRSRRALIIGAVIVAVLAGFATWLLAFSSVFGVHTVVVSGEHRLSEQQVLSAARVSTGTPLLRLDTAGIRARVETLPDVASVKVTTSFPTTVRITITERVPVGVVKHDSGFALVDRTGDQFRTVPKRPAHLPLLVVPVGTDARTTGGAVATVAAALPERVLTRTESIQALDPRAITLLLHDGTVVRWGGPDRSAMKADVLLALLSRPNTGQVSQIDVSDPSQPFTR